ncbi:MAG TPA: WbqC family protein [Bacteroidales bacterium]|nr:WbqC family protein [Bacteroidales bacterium]
MIVAAHQPHYFPWIGYFNKLYLSDVFMLMDNMNFTNNSYINRNRIINSKGIQYINIPLSKPNGIHTKINELVIENTRQKNWNIKTLRTLSHNYFGGKGFPEFYPIVEDILLKKFDLYIDLAICIEKEIMDFLGINTKIILASETNTTGNKENELIIKIMQNSGCNSVLLGLGASLNYVDFDFVKNEGYELLSQEYLYPKYYQKTEPFVQGVSILDLLFNENRNDASLIVKNAGKVKKI